MSLKRMSRALILLVLLALAGCGGDGDISPRDRSYQAVHRQLDRCYEAMDRGESIERITATCEAVGEGITR